MTAYNYLIRTMTVDGELVGEETNFVEEAMYEYFWQFSKLIKPGEVAQLIDISDDRVLSEVIRPEVQS